MAMGEAIEMIYCFANIGIIIEQVVYTLHAPTNTVEVVSTVSPVVSESKVNGRLPVPGL